MLEDESGNEHHGQIHGARLIKGKRGAALRFNGKSDYVDFGSVPSLTFTDSVTVSAWVYMEGIPRGQPIIIGRGRTFGLTQYTMTPHCVWYAVDHPKFYCSALVGRGRWRHITATFDGKTLKLYLDGQLRHATESPLRTINNGGEFRIGGGSGGYFKGVIGEIKVYRRSLSEEEVKFLFGQKPDLTEDEIRQVVTKETIQPVGPGKLSARPYPYYFDRRVAVVLNFGGRHLRSGAEAKVALLRAGHNVLLREINLERLPISGEANVWFTELNLAPGDYQIRATILDGRGRPLGEETRGQFSWPRRPSWPHGSGKTRLLNSLVTELLRVSGVEAAGASYTFVNPRDGWVFIASTADLRGSGRLALTLDSVPKEEAFLVHEPTSSSILETMRWLPAGKHMVRVWKEGHPVLEDLVVRSIPELVYSGFPQAPRISAYGPYDWDFLKGHVLNHVNTIVLSSGAQHIKTGGSEGDLVGEQRPYLLEWKKGGKRWLAETVVPGMRRGNESKATITAEEAYQFWTDNPGFQQALLDSVLVDEFHGGYPAYPAYTKAVRMIRANKTFSDKIFYAYCGEIYDGELSRVFGQALIDSGYRFSWERYLPEVESEGAARHLLQLQLRDKMQRWKRLLPGSEKQMVINFGHYLSAFPETQNTDPAVDFKVYMDMMFYLVANDPDFFGLYGIQEFTSAYADEEFIRWSAKLFRHYCIEGSTRLLSHDPYGLAHILNPDFDEGPRNWSFSPAEEGA